MKDNVHLIRSNSFHPEFKALVKQLDHDLAERDGEEHAFYAKFNSIEALKYIVLLYRNEKAVGCGAMKPFDEKSMEIKRMYTSPDNRGSGIATQILNELENWAVELRYERCVLETGKRQPEAIALYKKNGYTKITNYGQYINIENSLCFEKQLNQ